MTDNDDARLVDELYAWFTTEPVVESSDEQRAVILATVRRVRDVFDEQRTQLDRLRADQAKIRAAAAALREESAVTRTDSARLRDERDNARVEAAQLRSALDSRIVIEQAKGMIAARRGVSIDEAFQLLRQHARNHNARIHDVAAAVVNLGLDV